jgi:hypothetical protein
MLVLKPTSYNCKVWRPCKAVSGTALAKKNKYL